jgi:P-type Ca2+ transporter type 2C
LALGEGNGILVRYRADIKISAAGLLFFILFFRFVARLPENNSSAAVKGQEFVDILIVAVTVIVVAIPGLSPLSQLDIS